MTFNYVLLWNNDYKSFNFEGSKDDEKAYDFEKLWNTIFIMEHNRLVSDKSKIFPTLSPIKLYRLARERNIAQYQALVYYDWLPKLTGLVEYNKKIGKYKIT